MRERSHFDGHQTTGYTLHKNITKLQVSDRTIQCVSPNRGFATLLGRPTSAGMSIRLSLVRAQVLPALTGAWSFRWLVSRSIPLPHLRERPRAKCEDAG
ncbi:hypothetical protein N2603_38195 [Bradyrhizobium huanghuaihaiense]|uniref:hypothetical protein n=1 Tax=Bradyrhizobium huanghuaihaiense TaxID=990078 RepID=UPI0021AA1476|nr:hypothetical protein [Bradyrhizobium sp. CB3035]UWU75757.1 hypothetical protein N2603_38195 [Bradyrhizobium sp. CB3035]